jgi:16S rRNA (cytidine1402-2'-O)-methyltransferase
MSSDPASSLEPARDDGLSHALRQVAADAAGQDYPAATLYVIATPIGNRADITVRALACLARVDAIAAEDTRTTRQLLRYYGIDKPLIAAHRHNEHEAAAALVRRLQAGERIAYVSDAGTPGISDPGARLAAAVREAGLRVMPIPGASALTGVVSAAGLPDGAIHFAGFLPAKASQAAAALQALVALRAHLVFYEAPHRIVDTLGQIAATFPDRHCVVARELTKRFETIHRCATTDAVAWLEADPQRQRGEFVIVVEAPVDDATTADGALAAALPILAKLTAALSLSDAAALAADLTGVPRKLLYAHALQMRRDSEPD